MKRSINTIIIQFSDTQAIVLDGYQNNGTTQISVSDQGQFLLNNEGGTPIDENGFQIVDMNNINIDSYGGAENALRLDARDYSDVEIDHHAQEGARDRLNLFYYDPNDIKNPDLTEEERASIPPRWTSLPIFEAVDMINEGKPLIDEKFIRNHPLKGKNSPLQTPKNEDNRTNEQNDSFPQTLKIKQLKYIAIPDPLEEGQFFVFDLEENNGDIEVNLANVGDNQIQLISKNHYTIRAAAEIAEIDSFGIEVLDKLKSERGFVKVHNDFDKGIAVIEITNLDETRAQESSINTSPLFELNHAP